MNLRFHRGGAITALLLGGLLAFSGCADTDNSFEPGPLEFPVVDGLSSASLLRLDDRNLVYVGDSTPGKGFYLNLVDINDPTRIAASHEIGDNVAIITAKSGKIALIGATENDYEDFSGRSVKIYDATTLALLKSYPFIPDNISGRGIAFDTLHHRDPGLALGDKYVAAISIYEAGPDFAVGYSGAGYTTATHQHYISVYDITGAKGASYTKAYVQPVSPLVSGAAHTAVLDTLVLGTIGVPVGVATHGDYLIVGGSTATGVYKINSSAANLTISLEGSVTAGASHWMKDNGSYVLESVANTGGVRVWKWNGSAAPALVGTIAAQSSGSVQALSFGFGDDANKVYIYAKGSADLGQVKVVDLTDTATYSAPDTLFSYASHKGGSLSGIWNIEARKTGSDTYYVLTGGYGSTGIVLTFKNPPSSGAVTPLTDEVEYASAIRTLRTFVNSSGRIYYAVKNYTIAPVDSSPYRLELVPLN